jgi:hypothetical protein
LKPDDVQTLVQAIVQTLERIAPLGVEMDSVWVNMCCSLLHSFQLFNPNFSGLADTLYKTIEIVWTRLDVWFKARDVTEGEVVAGDVTDPNIASTSLALMELLIPKITVCYHCVCVCVCARARVYICVYMCVYVCVYVVYVRERYGERELTLLAVFE